MSSQTKLFPKSAFDVNSNQPGNRKAGGQGGGHKTPSSMAEGTADVSSGPEGSGETQTERLTNAMKRFGPAGARIGQAFNLMEVAEQEIEEAQRQWPEAEKEIDNAFKTLVPTAPLLRCERKSLYRAHCQELLERIGQAGEVEEADLGIPSKAEVLVLLSDISTQMPLGKESKLTYFFLAKETLGEENLREVGVWGAVQSRLSKVGDYREREIARAIGELRSHLRGKISRPS